MKEKTKNVDSKDEKLSQNQESKPIEKKKLSTFASIGIVLVFVGLLGVGGYFLLDKMGWEFGFNQNPGDDIKDNDFPPANTTLITRFAEYKEIPFEVTPKVPDYTVESGLKNVTNADTMNFQFLLEEKEVTGMLEENGFFVMDGYSDEFFPIYEYNRYSYTPNFVTTDSILHSYHLVFDYILKDLEENALADELKTLNSKMLAGSLAQYEELKGTEWENPAKRNVAFFAVGSILQDPAVEIPSIVKDEVEQELAFINKHDSMENSPVMNIGKDLNDLVDSTQGSLSLSGLKEDYTQYIPRGHYTKSAKLEAYFKSMMWYGRLTFRFKDADEIRSAMLITTLLNDDTNRSSWDKIYEPVNFFVGKSDDISYYDFNEVIKKVYGENPTLDKLTSSTTEFDTFVQETDKLDPPQINSMPVFTAELQDDREKEIKGFRFMGQRFTIDASVFQRLVYREIGDKETTCADFDPKETDCLSGARCLPSGLDIPAAMGSDLALEILEEEGETEYACYEENMTKMREYIDTLPVSQWTQNLYWGWMYQLNPLTELKGEGYPMFMQNEQWAKKDLNTYLGSWSELKHDTILYSKQVYAELGGGGPEEADDRGYVEPNYEVYVRLVSLLDMMKEGLESRGIATDKAKENISRMRELAMSLLTISKKELENETLTDEEYELIKTYGGQLEHLWTEVNEDEPEFKKTGSPDVYLQENPASIIADVATDPNGRVLEVGTGKVATIYVIVPIEGELRLTKGAVYSYYEFEWPMNDRLTDKKWRDLLNSEDSPELPGWTDSFVWSQD